MSLTNETIEEIKRLVYIQPRSINELAHALGKNWRTVNRYVEEMQMRSGIVKTRTFREGSRGALKLVYWNNTEKVFSSDVQEELFKRIEAGIDKQDFSPFDIYEQVDSEKRTSWAEEISNEKTYDFRAEELIPLFDGAQKEIAIFAGNTAFIHLGKKRNALEAMKDCIARGVLVRIITNVKLTDLKNLQTLLGLNAGLKKPLLEIKHNITPLRAYLFDETILRLGEVLLSDKKEGQSKHHLSVIYEVREKAWVEWMQRYFWKKFQEARPAKTRMEHMVRL